ncbi:hypothetical protein AAG570_004831 [Ranatra chinensis]|uniref:Uncharacterized protein n=1 Tax=Ranatra chinensis TaxID=642074 RepID=A0ABD0XYQ3_9HEMI
MVHLSFVQPQCHIDKGVAVLTTGGRAHGRGQRPASPILFAPVPYRQRGHRLTTGGRANGAVGFRTAFSPSDRFHQRVCPVSPRAVRWCGLNGLLALVNPVKPVLAAMLISSVEPKESESPGLSTDALTGTPKRGPKSPLVSRVVHQGWLFVPRHGVSLYASPEISGGGLAFGKEDESPELGSSLNRSQRGNCSTEYNTPLRHLSRLRTIPSPDIELPVMGHPMMYRPSQTPRLAVSSDRITLGSVLPVGGGPRKRPPSTGRGSRRATPRTPNDKRKRGSAAGNPIRLAREYRRAVGEYPTTDALRLTEAGQLPLQLGALRDHHEAYLYSTGLRRNGAKRGQRGPSRPWYRYLSGPSVGIPGI